MPDLASARPTRAPCRTWNTIHPKSPPSSSSSSLDGAGLGWVLHCTRRISLLSKNKKTAEKWWRHSRIELNRCKVIRQICITELWGLESFFGVGWYCNPAQSLGCEFQLVPAAGSGGNLERTTSKTYSAPTFSLFWHFPPQERLRQKSLFCAHLWFSRP